MAPPDLNEYLKLFGGIGQAAQEDNPWAPLVDGSNTIDKQLYGLAAQQPDQGIPGVTGGANLRQFDRISPGGKALQAGLVGLISGGIGGIGQNLGKAFVNNQTDLATQAMRDMQSGNAIAPGLSPSVFSAVKQQAAAQQMADAGRKADEANQLADAIKLKASPNASEVQMAMPEVQSAIEALRLHADDPENYPPLNAAQQHAIATAPLEVQRLIQGKEQQIGVGDRFGQNLSFKKGERELPGYTNVTGATPPITTVNDLREKIKSNEEVKTALRTLKENGDINGFMQIVGNDAQFQAALQSSIFNAYRKRTGSGARLEGPEGDMIKAMTPQVLSGDLFGAIKAGLLGRDQKQFSETMMNFLDEDRDVALYSQGFKSKSRPISFYPKDITERFGLQGLEESTPSTNPKTSLDSPLPKPEQDSGGAIGGISAEDEARIQARIKQKLSQ